MVNSLIIIDFIKLCAIPIKVLFLQGRITQTDSSNPSTSCTYVIPSGKSLPLPPLARRPPPPPILTSVLLSPNEVLKSGSKKVDYMFKIL